MLSICIPVFNYNIKLLVRSLIKQGEILKIPFEIIVIDDCSSLFKSENAIVCKDIKYIELPKNIGRAKIRNRFLEFSNFEYLLFLDCDSTIENPNYLSNYIEIIKQNPKVICGGSIYDYSNPKREILLRLKNGFYKESQTASKRSLSPYKSFLTNNFLITREVFQLIKFDERLSQYGHEDTLFGYELKKKNIELLHIDNVVVNGDIDTNEKFIQKTQKSIENLVSILSYIDYDADFINDISLLNIYYKIKPFESILHLLFKLSKPILTSCFKNGIVNLYLFDFYKLGLFIENKKSR